MPKSTSCGFQAGGQHPPQTLLLVHGPTLIVDIGFDANFTGAGKPTLGSIGVNALVDTGAITEFIDIDLANSLKLPVVDKQRVSGSSGSHEVPVFLGQIFVPSLAHVIYGRLGGVHLAAGGQRHSALLGRSFLQHFKMTYDGITGAVELLMP